MALWQAACSAEGCLQGAEEFPKAQCWQPRRVICQSRPENEPGGRSSSGELTALRCRRNRQAIEAQRTALKHTADPVKVVKTLVRLHASLKEYDKAYVAAQVVVHLLGERSPDEEQIIVRLKRYTKEQAVRPLGDRLWADSIYHERLRGPMGEILALCQGATGGAFAVDHGKLNINRKRDKVDVTSSMLRAFFADYVQVRGEDVMPRRGPRTLQGRRSERTGSREYLPDLHFRRAKDASSKGDRYPKRELWFMIAKAMAFTRPELAMVRLHPADEIEAIVQAAVSLAAPDFVISADPELVAEQQRRLVSSLSEQARPALFRAVKEALVDPGSLDLRPYLEAAEHTANRAGMLLCGDVESRDALLLSWDPGSMATRLPIRSKVQDLMLFCAVSEPIHGCGRRSASASRSRPRDGWAPSAGARAPQPLANLTRHSAAA